MEALLPSPFRGHNCTIVQERVNKYFVCSHVAGKNVPFLVYTGLLNNVIKCINKQCSIELIYSRQTLSGYSVNMFCCNKHQMALI